ncbi:unnamed protein product [Brassicogethes aeneus]|uniref:Protein kinase domain-containing protein n=1 Tax=Brassicogethes aeneus TaxID=1431903 RepID=A0A9P0FIS1_BRAAE|nr:unnamed protein product [Brassicogethes aeneus]
MEKIKVAIFYVTYFLCLGSELRRSEAVSCGNSASKTVSLSQDTFAAVCKLKVSSPENHVISMQFVESSINLHRTLMFNNSERHPPCTMSIVRDPCSQDSLPDVDLLTSEFEVVWAPPPNPNHTKGRKFIVTAIGKGKICKEPNMHTCMRIGRQPIFCISEKLVCDGIQHCPKSSSKSDEDEEICSGNLPNAASWEQLAQEFAVKILKKIKPPQEEMVSKHSWSKPKYEFASRETKKSSGHWPEWQLRKKETTTQKPTTTMDKPKATETISAILSKYGPWGYLMMGLLICGTVLMFCGLWECCFRKPKNQLDDTNTTQPTTVLIINQGEDGQIIPPPNYDDLDEPPSYNTLFPNLKTNTTIQEPNVSGSSSFYSARAIMGDLSRRNSNQEIHVVQINRQNDSMENSNLGDGSFVSALESHSLENNTSPLTWSVKYKNLNIIEYLISKGADAKIKTDNGDNILMIALENKNWEEDDFIKLNNIIKTSTNVDVNYTSKNGHNLLHIAVRRDWEDYIKLLIKENVNVNIANSNGVTPLMLACYKNNIKVVTILLNSGAEILKEDNHNRMALCYAISSEVKNSKPPFILVEKVLKELQKYMPIQEYIKKVIEVIISISEKPEFSYAMSEMMVTIMQYIVQHVQFGANILMDFNIFYQINKIISKHMRNQELLKFLLTITFEILFSKKDQIIYQSFTQSGLPNIFLEILKNDNDHCNNHLAFYSLVLLSTSNEIGGMWLNENFDTFFPYCEKYSTENSKDILDDHRLTIVKAKLKNLKTYTRPQEDLFSIHEDGTESNQNSHTLNISSKKTKRRKKAMKAKITKIKSAELLERLHLSGKKLPEPQVYEEDETSLQESIDHVLNFNYGTLCKEFLTLNTDNYGYMDSYGQGENIHFIKQEENPIVYSVLQFLQTDTNFQLPGKETYPQWANTLYNLPFDSPPFLQNLLAINKEKLLDANKKLKKGSLDNMLDDEVINSVDVVVEYLSELLQVIILKYQNNWDNDKTLNTCAHYTDVDDRGDQKPLPNYLAYLQKLEHLEKETLEDLQNKFSQLIVTIKDLVGKDVGECYKSLCTLEESLLKFKIRGRTLLFDLCSSENVKIRYSYENSYPQEENGVFLINYIEDVLNDRQICSSNKNITIKICDESLHNFSFKEFKPDSSNDLYFNDMSKMREKVESSKSLQCQSKENTLRDAYHLYHSMASVCDSEDEREDYKNLAARAFLSKCKREMKLAEEFEKGNIRKDPIVHGNLKPSNIFVDLNGVVKVAEFGTHKALYKTVEASKSSLIWFSQETYQGYKQSSTVDCTCASDIQVSGMLIYFILSCGVHPYGSDVMIILKNLEKAILNLPQSIDVLLVDIVTWMMMYDPNERPTIEQVLS